MTSSWRTVSVFLHAKSLCQCRCAATTETGRRETLGTRLRVQHNYERSVNAGSRRMKNWRLRDIETIGVRARGGGGGRGGRQPPRFRKLVKFYRQNAHDSGNSTWEKTKTLKREKRNGKCHSNKRG